MTDREKIIKALSPLHASDDTVEEVFKMAEKTKIYPIKRKGRTLLIAAVVAALLIGTALAVSGILGSPGLMQQLQLTDEDVQSLSESADSPLSAPAASDTHNGVTIAVEQAAADDSFARVALRIEGFQIPEGEAPALGERSVTVGGMPAPNSEFAFYNDLTWNGEEFVHPDGAPADKTDEELPIPYYTRGDGTLELDISFSPDLAAGGTELIGREVEIRIDALGTAPIAIGYTPPALTAEGPWVLRFTLDGSQAGRTWELNAPLGETGAVVTGVTLSPLSLHVTYDYPARFIEEIAYDENGNEVPTQTVLDPPLPYRIVMRDGTEYAGILGGGTLGYTGEDMDVYKLDMNLTRIIDPDEAAALVFRPVGFGDVPDSETEFYTVSLAD